MKIIVMFVILTCVFGTESMDDRPTKTAGKAPKLKAPPPRECFRTCIRVAPTPEMKEKINEVMKNCHIPKEFVEIQRINLGRNADKQERIRYTAYMSDPQDYWCIVSWESVLNTIIAKGFTADCNFECKINPL